MMSTARKKIVPFLAALAVVVAVGYGLVPEPVQVDLARVTKGDIRVTVDEDGKSRIRERYVVSTPLAGRLLRIDLEPGDEVASGETLLATIEPRNPELLDARTIAQAEARVSAAEASLQKMGPLLEEAQATQEFTEAELRRMRDARVKNLSAVSESEIQSKLLAYRTASAMLRIAKHNEEIARFELQQARAALIHSRPAVGEAPSPDNGWNFMILAPISGRVLRVFQESSAVVGSGTALLELGDRRDLEVEVDVLSRDAVRIEPGDKVWLEHWGGAKPLQGVVRLVEPSAFTKISTLGVEEQRVNVIVDLLDPPANRAALGDGFRVEARIVVDEAADVLTAPTSALFRSGEGWAAFLARDGVAHLQPVELGLRSGLAAEVLGGLSDGDAVVVHPGDNIFDGASIRQRE
ncbi:HlyD family efflux transporter periplasmic adaptor subunit [Pirellulales bacterium]|nr:HlyD family efflux transporter periplasmic adaptor subunit [Pirellulales bacterium]